MSKTPKVITGQIPPWYREIPKPSGWRSVRRLGRQVRTGLGHDSTITGAAQPSPPE